MPDLPIITSYWTVSIGGAAPAKVSSIEGFNVSVSAAESQMADANGNPITVLAAGLPTLSGDLTLTRVVDSDTTLFDWFKTVLSGQTAEKKDLVVTLNDQSGSPIKTFNVKQAIPTSMAFPSMNSSSGEIASETATMKYESFDVT